MAADIPWHVNSNSARYRAITAAANAAVWVLSLPLRRARCADCNGKGGHLDGCAHQPGRQFTSH